MCSVVGIISYFTPKPHFRFVKTFLIYIMTELCTVSNRVGKKTLHSRLLHFSMFLLLFSIPCESCTVSEKYNLRFLCNIEFRCLTFLLILHKILSAFLNKIFRTTLYVNHIFKLSVWFNSMDSVFLQITLCHFSFLSSATFVPHFFQFSF